MYPTIQTQPKSLFPFQSYSSRNDRTGWGRRLKICSHSSYETGIPGGKSGGGDFVVIQWTMVDSSWTHFHPSLLCGLVVIGIVIWIELTCWTFSTWLAGWGDNIHSCGFIWFIVKGVDGGKTCRVCRILLGFGKRSVRFLPELSVHVNIKDINVNGSDSPSYFAKKFLPPFSNNDRHIC